MGFNQPLTYLTSTQIAQITAAVPTPVQIVGAASAGAVPAQAGIDSSIRTNTPFLHRVTLLSGSSWLVPAGVLLINVRLVGAGGGGGAGSTLSPLYGCNGMPGQEICSTLATTPGALIPFAIGAGGAGGLSGTPVGGAGQIGGTTSMTGATSAPGGDGGKGGGAGNSTTLGGAGTPATRSNNGGGAGTYGNLTGGDGKNGGAGFIEVEYSA